MSDRETVQLASDERSVFTAVCDIIAVVLVRDGDDIEIGMDTQVMADLGIQSIDLVELSVQLQDHYGERVNLAGFLPDLDFEQIIELSVGQLVRHIARSLADTEES